MLEVVIATLAVLAVLLAVFGRPGWRALNRLLWHPGSTPIGPRDQIFEGIPLGTLPGGATAVGTRPATSEDTKGPVAVRFEPPQDVLPEQTGMLRLGRVVGRDVAAALVALAVDRHVQLCWQEIPDGSRSDWLITAISPPPSHQKLRSWLFDRIAQLPEPGTLTQLRWVLQVQGSRAQEDFAGAPDHRAWFPRMKATGGHYPPFGARVRSAEGAALRYQLAGFHQFLETADGDRLRFEEGAEVFSRLLPWAVALGVTEQWAQALREAADGLNPAYEGRWRDDLAWLGGVGTSGLMDSVAGVTMLGDGALQLGEGLGGTSGSGADGFGADGSGAGGFWGDSAGWGSAGWGGDGGIGAWGGGADGGGAAGTG